MRGTLVRSKSFGEPPACCFRDHRLGRRLQREEQADQRLFPLNDAFQLVDLIDRNAAALDLDDRLVGLAFAGAQIDDAVNAGIRALLAAPERLGVGDERDRPFFEFVLVALRQILGLQRAMRRSSFSRRA